MDLQGKWGLLWKQKGRNRWCWGSNNTGIIGGLCSWPLEALAEGFELVLKEKERSWWRCYRYVTGKHILLVRSTKTKASLQVSLHHWGNWVSRLGCWEHVCWLASCQVWPLFFYILLMITKRTHDKVRKLGGKIWKQSSQKRLREVREAEAWAVRPRLESAPSSSSVVLGVTSSP